VPLRNYSLTEPDDGGTLRYISLFVSKHITNTYIHKILRLVIREGKKSNTRERQKEEKN